jgi:hypothetical protein
MLEGLLGALLRLAGGWHGDAEPWPRGQIAKANSSKATINRRLAGSSTASS